VVLTKPASPRRRAILDAALECFVDHGYGATTIEAIRERSGASTGSVYHHFGSKEGIAAALYLDALRSYQAGAVAALHEGGVGALVRHHVAWIAESPDLARFLLAHRDPEVVAASRDELSSLNRAFFEDVRAWSAASDVRDLPLDLLHAVVLGPAQEWARHWLAGRAETDPKAAAALLADAAETAVRKEHR
jgi:AcrR family transcriptional regulator